MGNHLRIIFMTVFTLISWTLVYGQTGSIKGTVSEPGGETIVGANVYIEGSLQGTTTGIDGTYEIIGVPAGEIQLTASYVGYVKISKTLTLAEGETLTVDFDLQQEITTMEEFVVIGYGIQKKSDLTGSVATIKKKELTQVATTDVAEALQGRVAGVQVTSSSGEPGAAMKVRIRGIGTLNNSDPLYVVDGFPTNNISYLNPNDIESMEVLKDASATAIYGSRGANGVIMITTKKGTNTAVQNGKMKPLIEFNAYAGVQSPWKELDMADATEYATLRLESFANDGTEPSEDLYDRLTFVTDGQYKGTDWQDEIFRQAVIQNYSLSVTGGNDFSRYNISGAYFNQEGIVKNSGMEKIFLRFNNDYNFTEWLKGGVSFAYNQLNKTNYNGDLYEGVLPGVLRVDPVTPAWDQSTNNWGRADLSYINNPARIVEESKNNKNWENRYFTNLWGEASLSHDLNFRSQFGLDYRDYKYKNYLPEFFITTDEQRSESSLYEQRSEGLNWAWSNYFNYIKDINEDHRINAMLGMEAQYNSWNGMWVQAYDVPDDENLYYLSASENLEPQFGSTQWENSILSYFGRVNYSYKNKYLATATIRYDGSSKFTEDYRWGVFPSFSLGWNLKEEAFLKDVDFLSSLKLRGGWGEVGNQASVDNYAYVTTVTPGNYYVFNDQPVPGSIPTSLSNPEIQWEKSTSTNVGFDASFFNSQLMLNFDYFTKTTSDMLLRVPIPDYVGAEGPFVNAGEMKNSGVEFALTYRDYDSEFKWDVSANMSFIKNEVTSLAGGEPIESGNINKVGNTTRTEEGYELAYFYGLQTDGIFNTQDELDAYVNSDGALIQPNAQPGDVKFIDNNGDGKINSDDRVYLGSAMPDFTFGLSANFEYKNFDLRLFLQGSQGNELVYAMTRFIESSNGWENSLASRMDRWTPDNPDSNEPRMTDKDLNKNIEQFSDRYVSDGSYIRLKNLQLGYTLPNTLASSIGVNKLRVYLSMDNLLTITDYKGFDPEIGDYYSNPLYFGVDVGNYPVARTIMGGITINL